MAKVDQFQTSPMLAVNVSFDITWADGLAGGT